MADSRKKTNGKKTSNTTKKTSAKTSPKATPIKKNGVKEEISIVIWLGIAILLVLSVFDLCGKVGSGIAYGLFGAFGLLAYPFPFILFVMAVFAISNKYKTGAFKKKVIAVIIMIIAICALMQMASGGHDSHMTIANYVKNSAVYRNGGGLIGGALTALLAPLFGSAGAIVIMVVILIVGFVLFAGKAILTILFSKSKDAAKRTNENLKQKHIENKQRRAEERAAQLEAEKAAEEEAAKEAERERLRALAAKDKQNGLKDIRFVNGEINIDDNTNKPANYILKSKSEDDFAKSDTASEPVKTKKPESKFTVNVNHMQELSSVKRDIANEKPSENTEPILNFGKGKTNNKDFYVQGELFPEEDEPLVEEPAKGKESGKGLSKAERGEAIPLTEEEITPVIPEYVFPPLDLLERGHYSIDQDSLNDHLQATAKRLQDTLDSFGVKAQVTDVSCGPAVTRFELQPEMGVKVSRIVSLSDDIKLNLAVQDIRIEAPIPGKAAVGIEVPNKENSTIMLRDLLETQEFQDAKSKVSFTAGRDISGKVVVSDISKMPHLLIAGATGSGKSVCINTMILSIIYKAKPSEVRLIMIDPKVVELSVYNGIPHLMIPVVTDPKKAAGALNWAVMEMTDRYKKFADLNVRDIKGYNEKMDKLAEQNLESENYKKLPQIVIIIDELADLMMVAPGEVEDAICRLAQLARAAGIHLVVATQRPSVNVITGVIKANIPSRIAFSVASQVDSRTILDMAGAEKLLGKGDMLFYPSGYQKPLRVQGAFVSDEEISAVVDFVKGETQYEQTILDTINTAAIGGGAKAGPNADDRDVYFAEAGRFIIEKDKASIGMLQRVFKIGFNRAARIMEQLYEAGVVGPEEGTKPRKILMTEAEFQTYVEENL